ncbi:hypothetical protein DFJ73DRAFT_758137 [Zopfochytrium polystomum]|nr:hypothetical protein DFJ73DRAFT_758137 [Zopfochytrium polystomum]
MQSLTSAEPNPTLRARFLPLILALFLSSLLLRIANDLDARTALAGVASLKCPVRRRCDNSPTVVLSSDASAPSPNLDELLGADNFEDKYHVPEVGRKITAFSSRSTRPLGASHSRRTPQLPPPLNWRAIRRLEIDTQEGNKVEENPNADIPQGSPPTSRHGQKSLRFGNRTKNALHDLTKILKVYRIWGHTVYPSARFEEFVTMTEMLCHRKKLKIAQKAFLEEERGLATGGYADRPPPPPPEDARCRNQQSTTMEELAPGHQPRLLYPTTLGMLPGGALVEGSGVRLAAVEWEGMDQPAEERRNAVRVLKASNFDPRRKEQHHRVPVLGFGFNPQFVDFRHRALPPNDSLPATTTL